MRLTATGLGVGTTPNYALDVTGPGTISTINQSWNLFSGVQAVVRCGSDAHLDFGTMTAHSTNLIVNGTRILMISSSGATTLAGSLAMSSNKITGLAAAT